MKAPLSWLRDYVDIDISNKEFSDKMTLSGSKVETIDDMYGEISKVVIGKITELSKHPDADKLQVSKVDIGSETVQIVTGAQNIKVGDIIPVALVGAKLPGDKSISKGKLRGVESFGMMCSIQELNLTKEDYPEADEDGIFILNEDYPLGMDVKEALNLKEVVFDFEITPNRPDCLSIEGMAREVAVTLNKPFKIKEYKYNQTSEKSCDFVKVEIQDELCKRYTCKVVKNIKIGDSPKWIKERLKAAGIRAINNIVDITNYVMVELGQPMHAFDLDKIKDNKIIVRRAKNGEMINTLDEQERKLDDTMLVIADSKDSLAVAGVMGGLETKVENDTKNILFESANFEGAQVRTTGKKLGFRTDSSTRFEKGLDPENTIRAIDMAVNLIEKLGIGEICQGIIDIYPNRANTKQVVFRPEKINSFLGTNISEKFMVDTLKSLEFQVDLDKKTVEVPSFRRDVAIEADLAEEIARFFDYNKIEPTLLSGKTSMQGKRNKKQRVELAIKETMISCGFSEIYTYSFGSPKVYDKLLLDDNSVLRKDVVIINPLGEDYSVMRTTTVSSMLEVLSLNYNRRNESAKLFEIGLVYLPQDGEDLPLEKGVITFGAYGNTDFYEVKGAVEELFIALGIKRYEFTTEGENPTFHPAKTAKIFVSGKEIGVIGEIHPAVAEKYECSPNTFIAILELQSVVENYNNVFKYKQLPKFPSIQRDIAMLVKDEVLVSQIAAIIEKKSGKILEEIKLFDVYKGKQIAEGMKSVAYSIIFRAQDRTLTEEEINITMKNVVDGLKNSINAELR